MPVLLSVASAPARRFVDQPSAVPFWQLLHREADRLYPALHTLWATLFADFRDAVALTALEAALRQGNLLQIEALLSAAWHDEAAVVARQLLPPLFRQTIEQTATALIPTTAASLHVPAVAIAFNVADPAVLHAIDYYAGTQIVGIQERTVAAVRQAIRVGFEEGGGISAQVKRLREILGVTPRQAESIRRIRQDAEARGWSPSRVDTTVERATQKALRLRARTIARTESIDVASQGQQALWRQQAEMGLLDDTYRRFWLITPDDRTCTTICLRIPGMNPEGVGLEQPFATPIGPIFHPTAHVVCRCAVDLRQVS